MPPEAPKGILRDPNKPRRVRGLHGASLLVPHSRSAEPDRKASPLYPNNRTYTSLGQARYSSTLQAYCHRCTNAGAGAISASSANSDRRAREHNRGMQRREWRT